MRVHVLLSTFNGERWVAAQIDSVLAQTHDDLVLEVRDDGSTDATRSVLAEYVALDARVRWSAGGNVGAAASFLSLLAAARGTEAVAFCDQDDVWEPDHLERAVTALAAAQPGPAMWCSDILVCDEELQPRGPRGLVRHPPSFVNALVENIAPGCTIVLDPAAVALLSDARPSSPVMHDAWCYLVVAAFGQVLYDPCPSVRYRIHDANALGLSAGRLAVGRDRLRRAWRGEHVGAWTRQAAELQREYGDRLPQGPAAELRAFLAGRHRLGARLRYALAGGARRQRPLGTAAMRALYLLGRV